MASKRPRKPKTASQPATASPRPESDDDAAALLAAQRAVLREKYRRSGIVQASDAGPLSHLFDRQLRVVLDPAKFKALLCGGRAGKTSTAIFDFVHGMQTKPRSQHLYVSQTRTNAKNILWEPLRLLNDQYRWGLKLNETELRARHPNGSWLLCAGSDTRRELEKMRGIPWTKVRIDECGSHRPSYLKYLVEEVIEPRLMDRSGDLWLMGTPTKQAFGYFYDATNGRIPGYSVHHWTAADNPHMPFAQFKADLFARRKWNDDNPIWRREYLAEWVVESEALVYRFLRERNVVAALGTLLARDRWMRVLGIDFGYGHGTAMSVLTYPARYGQEVVVEYSMKVFGKAPTEVAELINKLVVDYKPWKIVGDVNGLGKGYATEYNLRYADQPIVAANKADRRGGIEVVSDALYTGKLKSLERNDGLHREWATLLWDEKHEDIAEGQEDDESDAVQYAFKEVPAFLNDDKAPRAPEFPKHVEEDREDYKPPRRRYDEVSDL